MSAVYLVGILDFVFAEDKDDDEVCHRVQLKDQANRIFYDKLTFIYLEMPKFTKTEAELETAFDKWLFVLKRLPELTERPAHLQERVFAKLFQAAEVGKFNRKEMAQYEQSLKYYRDMKNVIDTAALEAEVKGEAKGHEKGLVEGHEKGLVEGEMKKAIEMARKLLQKNMSLSDIVEITGLSEEVVNALL